MSFPPFASSLTILLIDLLLPPCAATVLQEICRTRFYFSKSFAYFPYPSFTRSSFGMNLRDAEFMQ